MPPIRIGTEIMDLRDGRTCIVSDIRPDGVTLCRKRSLTTGRWQTIRVEGNHRFVRLSGKPLYRFGLAKAVADGEQRRNAARAKYGDDVVRLADGLGLGYAEAAKLRYGVSA